MVLVTVEKPDGRSISRKVPVDSWVEEGYRESLIERLCADLT